MTTEPSGLDEFHPDTTSNPTQPVEPKPVKPRKPRAGKPKPEAKVDPLSPPPMLDRHGNPIRDARKR